MKWMKEEVRKNRKKVTMPGTFTHRDMKMEYAFSRLKDRYRIDRKGKENERHEEDEKEEKKKNITIKTSCSHVDTC